MILLNSRSRQSFKMIRHFLVKKTKIGNTRRKDQVQVYPKGTFLSAAGAVADLHTSAGICQAG